MCPEPSPAEAMVLGPLGALCGSVLSDGLTNWGIRSGKVLVGSGSAFTCALAAVLISLASVGLAMAGVALMFFVVAFNFGIAQAAISELLPNRARGVGTSVYVATSNLLVAACGPVAISALIDHVFHNPAALPLSIRIAAPGMFLLAGLVLLVGSRSFAAGVFHRREGG